MNIIAIYCNIYCNNLFLGNLYCNNLFLCKLYCNNLFLKKIYCNNLLLTAIILQTPGSKKANTKMKLLNVLTNAVLH